MRLQPWEVSVWWEAHKHDPVIEAVLDKTQARVYEGKGLDTLVYCAVVALALITLGRMIRGTS